MVKRKNDIIVDDIGETYQKKDGKTHTKAWYCRLTKEEEEKAMKEIKRVLGTGKEGGEDEK